MEAEKRQLERLSVLREIRETGLVANYEIADMTVGLLRDFFMLQDVAIELSLLAGPTKDKNRKRRVHVPLVIRDRNGASCFAAIALPKESSVEFHEQADMKRDDRKLEYEFRHGDVELKDIVVYFYLYGKVYFRKRYGKLFIELYHHELDRLDLFRTAGFEMHKMSHAHQEYRAVLFLTRDMFESISMVLGR